MTPSKRWRIISLGFLSLYLLFSLVPILWMVLSSFKTYYQTLLLPPQLIFKPIPTAYLNVFLGGMGKVFLNSLKVAFIDISLALLLSIPAAYSLARFKSKATENIGFWLLSLRMAPAFGVVIPIYILMQHFRLLDTIFAVNAAHLLVNVPFAVWLFKSYFEDIPVEIEESALVDGATRFQALVHILIPMSMPMVATVTILTFIFSWNELFFAFVLTSSKGMTVPVLVASLAGSMAFNWPLLCAISVCSMIPAFILAFIVQRHIVRGLTLGAVR